VVSGAAGVYVGTLLEDAGISTDLTITPGQTVSVNGDPLLPQAPSWGGGGFMVQERGSLDLRFVALGASAGTFAMNGGSLSLSDMVVHADVMEGLLNHMDDAGSSVQLTHVTMPEFPERGVGMGTATRDDAGGTLSFEPADLAQWFLGQVRCLWCCFCYRSLVWELIRHLLLPLQCFCATRTCTIATRSQAAQTRHTVVCSRACQHVAWGASVDRTQRDAMELPSTSMVVQTGLCCFAFQASEQAPSPSGTWVSAARSRHAKTKGYQWTYSCRARLRNRRALPPPQAIAMAATMQVGKDGRITQDSHRVTIPAIRNYVTPTAG
jgi:hypothetical protein